MSTAATKTILVVEDKGPVRSVLFEILENLGYTVLQAPDGEQALSLAEDHDGAIDLLLVDIVMPGLQGNEVAERLRATRPQTRVLFMSGYTKKTTAQNLITKSGAGFLAKPFSLPELKAKLAEVFDEPVSE